MQCKEAQVERFDVCIVGAGPHGLAVLSALLNPDATLTETDIRRLGNARRRQLRVCVVDRHSHWLHDWEHRFSTLDISTLRSPALAHPDAFSAESLVEFAVRQNRQAKLRSLNLEGSSVGGLSQIGEGLFELPSNALFLDFCRKLIAGLEHQYLCGELASIAPLSKKRSLVRLADGRGVQANAVVLAVGIVGQLAIPSGFQRLWQSQRRPVETGSDPDETRARSSTSKHLAAGVDDPDDNEQLRSHSLRHLNEWAFDFNGPRRSVLVVGGGLCAAQAALLAVKHGHDVVLCSRSPLRTRFFDLPLEWMDWRKHKRMHFDMLSCPSLSDRVRMMRRLRLGGSIPPGYRAEIDRAVAERQLSCLVDECADAIAQEEEDEDEDGSGGLAVKLVRSGRVLRVTTVLLATSICPDFGRLESALAAFGSMKLVHGFPVLTQDLSIDFASDGAELPPVFVVGHMAALQLGPDASNLSGARRAAQIIASALGLHDHRIAIDNTFDRLSEVEA